MVERVHSDINDTTILIVTLFIVTRWLVGEFYLILSFTMTRCTNEVGFFNQIYYSTTHYQLPNNSLLEINLL